MEDQKMKSEQYFSIKEGDVVTFDVLTWDEGYEFGAPCLMLSPVIRENSDSHAEAMIEDICIDLVCQDKIVQNNESDQIEWRGWNLKYLRWKFNEALAGKKFPKMNYQATRKKVKFIKDKRGELIWEDISE